VNKRDAKVLQYTAKHVKGPLCATVKRARLMSSQGTQQIAHLDVENAKVGHGVLPPFRGAESLVAEHAVEDHLNPQPKQDNYWHRDHRQNRAVCGRPQKAHTMNPDHEERCAPVVIVLHGVLGLSIHTAERDPP